MSPRRALRVVVCGCVSVGAYHHLLGDGGPKTRVAGGLTWDLGCAWVGGILFYGWCGAGWVSAGRRQG